MDHGTAWGRRGAGPAAHGLATSPGALARAATPFSPARARLEETEVSGEAAQALRLMLTVHLTELLVAEMTWAALVGKIGDGFQVGQCSGRY